MPGDWAVPKRNPLLKLTISKRTSTAIMYNCQGKPTACGLSNLPAVGLVVSGGHSSLFYIKDFKNFKLLGSTRDDAAGEAFDKVARILDLGYPGRSGH